MSRAWIVVVSALMACSSSPCELGQELVSARDERGTLSHAIVLDSPFPDLAARPYGGVLCTTCTGFATFGAGLQLGRSNGPLYQVAAGGDGSIYVLHAPDGTAGPRELEGLTAGGDLAWHRPVDEVSGATRLIAVSNGVYVDRDSGGPTLTFYAAADGASRDVVAPHALTAGEAGVFVGAANADGAASTIGLIGPTGAPRWERTWSADGHLVGIGEALATKDGGLIVVIGAGRVIELGDRTLRSNNPAGGSFVVALDAAGQTLWAFEVELAFSPHVVLATVERLAITPTGDVLLAGTLGSLDSGDAYLAEADEHGIDLIYPIDGEAEQRLEGMVASADGVAWLAVANEPRGEAHTPMRFADHAFDQPGLYVFALRP